MKKEHTIIYYILVSLMFALFGYQVFLLWNVLSEQEQPATEFIVSEDL